MNDSFFGIERLRETPAYSPVEAAHYLRLPPSTLRAWCLGQACGGQRRPRFEPVIEIADRKRRSLSFVNLVEAHVLAALRREFHVPLPKIREAVAYLRAELHSPRPLAEQQFVTDGVDLLVEHFGKLFNVNRRRFELKEVMQAYLQRVKRDEQGLPVKLFLLTRQQAPTEQPALVAVDPRVAFGRPVLAGTGVPTAVLAEQFKAGEDSPGAGRRLRRGHPGHCRSDPLRARGRLDGLTLFVHESVGAKIIPAVLRELGAEVLTVTDVFGADTRDKVWLRRAAPAPRAGSSSPATG